MNLKSTSVSSQSHGEILLEGVKTLRNRELLFDCTLKADGQEVPVHKLVLAACSDYFQSMFCGNMKESKQSSVELQGITAATLKALVNFAYTGNLELSLDNVEDIVSGAQYFQMAEAVELCTNFLQRNLTLETVIDIQNLANTYALDPVESATEAFLLYKFRNISGDIIPLLEREIFFNLMGSNSLNIKSEYTLFDKLMSFKSVLSEDTFREALRYVRFPLMTSEELSRVADTEVMSSSRSKYLLEEALEYKKDALRQPVMQTPRTQVRSDITSFLFSTENVIFHTNLKKRVVFLKPSKCLQNIELERIAVVDNFLYVCGNSTTSHTVFQRYDPRFNVWQELPHPIVKKTDFLLIPHQGQIYAIGGYCNRSVERYSISDNKWQKVAPINCDSFLSAGVVCENRIYVSGGLDFDSDECDEDQADVSCYDPMSDTWESKSQMIEKRRRHLMATISDKIFAFGGENSSESVEYFDPGMNQWTLTTSKLRGPICALFQCCTDVYICKMANMRKILASGINEEIIFEKYDPETGRVTNSIRRVVKTKNTSFEDYQCGWTFSCACLTFP